MSTQNESESSLQNVSTGSTGRSNQSGDRDPSLDSLQSRGMTSADEGDALPTGVADIAGTSVPGSSLTGASGAGSDAGSHGSGTGAAGSTAKKEMLRQELGQLKTELDNLVSHAARLSERELGEAYQMLMARFQAYRAKCRDMAGNYGQQLNQQMDATRERVKEKPVQSVAIAAGAGMLVGMVMRRRRRDVHDR